ncbi:cadherin-like domain-containing protein [Paenibacillus sp. MBLB4367]|uniref:cadherin-like domain-containing protein n=1 Tax=Paenibacillus sp. MBLB4367 TaxID=3384767 RepID=UPI003907F886
MSKITNRFVVSLLLAVLVFAAAGQPRAHAADAPAKKVYEVTWATEDLSTPMSWVQSQYFNNPQYKETRFENYGSTTPVPPGGPRETAFYMAYKEDGLYMFFQSNESETEADGNLKLSWLEFYLQTGEGDLPYHQMIVPTDGQNIEYYEWQTENRHNRPLKDNVRVNSQQIPTGWGTVVVIPWEAVYDYVPVDGGNWEFNVIRWSPTVAPSWGGNVHQPGRFNLLHFQTPTAQQRTAIQKYMLTKSWNKFQTTSGQLTNYWSTNPATSDQTFYNRTISPLIAEGTAAGAQMSNLANLNAEQTNLLYGQVADWMELRYNVDDSRQQYLKKLLMHVNQPPTVTDATYVTMVNTPASGVIAGTDEDGDALTYSLGTAPAHGTVTVNANGSWTYTPNAGFTGKDHFTAVVSDSRGGTVTGTVNLTVTPGPVTTATLTPAVPNGNNGWYTTDVSVTLATYDDLVGVARTEFRLGSGAWNVYNGPIPVSGEGVNMLEYRGIDIAGNAEAAKSVTIKIDKTAPVLNVTLDRTVLSQSNHQLVPITATLANSDAISGIASIELTSVTSNEPDNGEGDGNTTGDIAGADIGTADTSFSLRAERAGGGNGRIYTVTYTATDNAGLTTTATVTVTVPH